MPRTLQKVHKQIAKKRGVIDSLHEFSRDARRLRRAGCRDDRLNRHTSAVMKARQPYMERIEYFHNVVQNHDEPLTDEALVEVVNQCINRDSDELAQLQQERRKGRPPIRREEALTQRTQAEEKEFKTGFWMPDLSDEDAFLKLKHWNGEWTALSSAKFIRLVLGGEKQSSSFPPKGMS
ncbi:hypothetical protein N7520_003808 [Penicillium odoratum]|uniref:uncharacterized protein n=1 Tax=Penicillium odoratum TaxID=1167516 RepID=UPI0025496262|nr:uncharacterized protein N7520_003808 [Penicillium odoratum]KAJ5769249.1 hypothetical protein N7520_003808 [Penicillium odoratum]